ncbi:hypothetical protein [Nocardiopsis sp. MG754419]|uniref:hypothetical protein n=1 Tax=Nocardiopsis sp. MG754419 TaxID=2259865 RepID=UPI001BAB98FC|nr:hypothetical protein [Nocardiopsis sp. MG754419]
METTVHYLHAESDSGIRHCTDAHPMHLFTREDCTRAFERAGLGVEFLPVEQGGVFGTGLYVGTR